jgi:murein L,D-transpeptidase YafK
MVKRFVVAAGLVLALAACQDDGLSRSSTRHLSPIPPATMSLMATKGMSKSDPIVIRSYKKESEMEVWKRGSDGRYALLKTFPICRWSGQLGPKRKEGDRQAPEGFYAITPAQMNPNSAYYLSFDTGYPNAVDRANGGSGSALMVHGSCSSRGCFAMTDESIAEIYAIAREALAGGQRSFQFQSYPFRMTAKNLAQHRYDPNIAFWKNLKEGSDYFEVAREEPQVSVADRRYKFNVADTSAVAAVVQKERQDEQDVAELVAKGVPPIKLVYDDGGGHESFQQALANATGGDSLAVDSRLPNRLGDVSRPEALTAGPREIVLDESGRPKHDTPTTALAFASAPVAPASATQAPVAQAPVAQAKASPESAVPAPAQVAQAKAVSAPVRVAQAKAAPAPLKAAPAVVARAKPAPVAVASIHQPVTASAAEETPFYKKMFGGIGDLFATSSAPASVEPVQPATANGQARNPALKPQASNRTQTNVAIAN